MVKLAFLTEHQFKHFPHKPRIVTEIVSILDNGAVNTFPAEFLPYSHELSLVISVNCFEFFLNIRPICGLFSLAHSSRFQTFLDQREVNFSISDCIHFELFDLRSIVMEDFQLPVAESVEIEEVHFAEEFEQLVYVALGVFFTE